MAFSPRKSDGEDLNNGVPRTEEGEGEGEAAAAGQRSQSRGRQTLSLEEEEGLRTEG